MDYWVPFLLQGTVKDNKEVAEQPPFWIWVVSVLQVKYILIGVAAFALWHWLR